MKEKQIFLQNEIFEIVPIFLNIWFFFIAACYLIATLKTATWKLIIISG